MKKNKYKRSEKFIRTTRLEFPKNLLEFPKNWIDIIA